jgi:hypothetical protein
VVRFAIASVAFMSEIKRLTLEQAMRHLQFRAQLRRAGDRGKRKTFAYTDIDAEAAGVVLDALNARLRISVIFNSQLAERKENDAA